MPSVLPLGTAWVEKVSYKYSLTQEMLWSLHVLSDSTHHQDRLDWCLRVAKELPAEIASDLDYLSTDFDQWVYFIQLVAAVEGDKIYPWSWVFSELTQMGQALFVYFLFGRVVKVGDLIRYIRQPALTDQFLRANPNLGNEDMVRGLLADPERVRSKFLAVLEGYWDLVFAQEAAKLEPIFFASLQEKIKLMQTAGFEQLLQSLGLGIQLVNDRLVGRALIRDEEAELDLGVEQVERILILPTIFATPHLFPLFEQKQLILRYPLPYPTGEQLQLSDAELLATLKALSDETRLKILRLIAEKPRYSGELAAELGFSEPTISRHMKQLRTVGIVKVEKCDNFVYYSLEKGVLEALWPALANYFGLK